MVCVASQASGFVYDMHGRRRPKPHTQASGGSHQLYTPQTTPSRTKPTPRDQKLRWPSPNKVISHGVTADNSKTHGKGKRGVHGVGWGDAPPSLEDQQLLIGRAGGGLKVHSSTSATPGGSS